MTQPKKRRKPQNADWHNWNAFEKFCDREGIQNKPEDWELWWKCWKAGYNAAMNC